MEKIISIYFFFPPKLGYKKAESEESKIRIRLRSRKLPT